MTVSSNDGTSATATDAATGVGLPATLQQVTLSASVPSAAAGIGTIGLDNNGSLPTVTQQTSTTGTSSTGLSGSPNAAIASTKMATLKLATLKFATLKLATLKFATLKLATLKFATLTIGSQSVAPLSEDLLSNIGVTYPDGCAGSACTDWQGILAGSQYAGFPLQSVSLQDVLNTTGSDAPDNSNPAARLNALPLSDIDVSGSSLGALPVAAYALGGTSIDEIPLSSADLNSDGSVNEDQTLTDWCNDLAGVQWPCSDFGITSDTDTTDAANVTVLSLGISGVPLASIPLNSVPLQSGTVDASPVGALSLAGTDLNDTGLGTLKLATLKLATLKFATLKFATLPIDQVNTASIALGSIPLTDINMTEDIPLSDGTTGSHPVGPDRTQRDPERGQHRQLLPHAGQLRQRHAGRSAVRLGHSAHCGAVRRLGLRLHDDRRRDRGRPQQRVHRHDHSGRPPRRRGGRLRYHDRPVHRRDHLQRPVRPQWPLLR